MEECSTTSCIGFRAFFTSNWSSTTNIYEIDSSESRLAHGSLKDIWATCLKQRLGSKIWECCRISRDSFWSEIGVNMEYMKIIQWSRLPTFFLEIPTWYDVWRKGEASVEKESIILSYIVTQPYTLCWMCRLPISSKFFTIIFPFPDPDHALQ